VSNILFSGERISLSFAGKAVEEALVHGFIVVDDKMSIKIANDIFETFLSDYLMNAESSLEKHGQKMTGYLLPNGRLDMRLVLEKFSKHYNEAFPDTDMAQKEAHGRRLFLTFLKPIINGVGSCHIESGTRDEKRIDLEIDYNGYKDIVEMRIWHGEKYLESGELQLADYLKSFDLDAGYLLIFSNLASKEVRGSRVSEINGKKITTVVI
jgi:hypothetical protein